MHHSAPPECSFDRMQMGEESLRREKQFRAGKIADRCVGIHERIVLDSHGIGGG
jgi:hypothetical protein